ncbi:MAG: hypothetical protein WBD20_27100, partial [Pirellulaceae bacterium]
MNTCRYLAIANLIAFLANATVMAEKPMSETEERLVDKMVDVSLAHAKLAKKRYAFVAVGELSKLARGTVEKDHVPIFRIGAGTPGDNMVYKASANGLAPSIWRQSLVCKGQAYRRDNVGYAAAKIDDRVPPSKALVSVSPILQSLAYASGLTCTKTNLDIVDTLILSERSELAKAFYRNGNLNGQWKINTPLPTPSSPVVEANVELGKASGY